MDVLSYKVLAWQVLRAGGPWPSGLTGDIVHAAIEVRRTLWPELLELRFHAVPAVPARGTRALIRHAASGACCGDAVYRLNLIVDDTSSVTSVDRRP